MPARNSSEEHSVMSMDTHDLSPLRKKPAETLEAAADAAALRANLAYILAAEAIEALPAKLRDIDRSQAPHEVKASERKATLELVEVLNTSARATADESLRLQQATNDLRKTELETAERHLQQHKDDPALQRQHRCAFAAFRKSSGELAHGEAMRHKTTATGIAEAAMARFREVSGRLAEVRRSVLMTTGHAQANARTELDTWTLQFDDAATAHRDAWFAALHDAIPRGDHHEISRLRRAFECADRALAATATEQESIEIDSPSR
jgi:hypothetical protein